MNEQRIREIASQCSDFAEQIPFFCGIENGLTWEATIQKARDLKFAELIVRECIREIGYKSVELLDIDFYPHYQERLKKYFGVEG